MVDRESGFGSPKVTDGRCIFQTFWSETIGDEGIKLDHEDGQEERWIVEMRKRVSTQIVGLRPEHD